MTDPASLLPPNSTPLERGLEAMSAARIEALSVPVRALWSAADCPAALLAHLAWGLGVPEWDPLWGDSQRRAVIASAIPVARRRGTLGSVRAVLADAGHPDAQIVEGAYGWLVGDGSRVGDPGLKIGSRGAWASYRVTLRRPITHPQGQSMRRLLEATAPARCQLATLSYPWAAWVVGDGTRTGAHTLIPAAGGTA